MVEISGSLVELVTSNSGEANTTLYISGCKVKENQAVVITVGHQHKYREALLWIGETYIWQPAQHLHTVLVNHEEFNQRK